MRDGLRSAVVVVAGAVLAFGCNPGFTEMCTAGYVLDSTGSRCVPADGAVIEDAGTDAAMGDAHVPCGGICNGSTSHCLVAGATETCVGCTGDPDCHGTDSRCELTSHTCVACLDESTCTTASAARCDTTDHMCHGCTASADCTHLTGTPACEMTSGACVACLTNTDCDATHGCDLSTHACVPFTAMSAATCHSCVRDAECHTGQLCVPMMYDDPNTPAADPMPAGNHCLWRQDATGAGAPNGDCTTLRPYVRGTPMTSVDAMMTTMCTLRQSTCEAQAGFSMTDCMTLDAAGNARCGQASLSDGQCQMFGATTNRCSVFCLSDDDCPSGSPCDTGASPRVCMF